MLAPAVGRPKPKSKCPLATMGTKKTAEHVQPQGPSRPPYRNWAIYTQIDQWA